jgi:hypothetical protein
MENLKERQHSDDLDVDGRIILMDVKGIIWQGVDWNHMAQDADRWRTLVNTIMNFRVPYNVRNFLTI